ncbi:MAG: branched-chain amino acid transaminase [Myxococcota bacterium]
MPEKTRIWMNGEIVPYEAATTHVLSHSLHYGLAAFEGIRCYETADGRSAVFRLREHIERLLHSCHIATIETPYTKNQLIDATQDVLRINELKHGYIRPLVWLGEGSIKVAADDNKVNVAIAAWPWGAYLGQDALEKGIRCCVSSYTRIGVRSHYEKAKLSGQYVNSVLAKREAILNGYNEAIMLDAQGFVAEGTGENIIVVRDGILYTPPRGSSILAGITRDCLIKVAQAEGLTIREETITRSDLYIADEVFMCGTAAEVTPVREIDGRRIGEGARGPICKTIQDAFFKVVRGQDDRFSDWLTYV